MLIPYAVFTILGMIFLWIVKLIKGDTCWSEYVISPLVPLLKYGATSGNLALWFLLSLFFVYVVFYFTQSIDLKVNYVCFVAIIFAYLIYLLQIRYPAIISSVLIGLSFFSLGHVLREKQFDLKIFIPSLCTGIVLAIYNPSIVDVCSNLLLKGDYLTWVIYSIVSIIVINNIFKRILYTFPILSYIGRNAIVFFGSHWIFLHLIDCIIRMNNLVDKNYIVFIYGISLIVLLPLVTWVLNHPKLKFLIGK